MPDTNLIPGFFGKIPAAGDFVSWNLPRTFTDRWDRWMSMGLRAQPAIDPLDPRAWRFIVPAGIFGDSPAAGVWRMSEDRAGRRYPLVIARLGPPPAPDDAWFDAIAKSLAGAVESYWEPDQLASRLGRLNSAGTGAKEPEILFWLDDWEVHELRFTDIHDLAETGLPRMRGARAVAEGG